MDRGPRAKDMFGAASDIEGIKTLDQKKRANIFAGLTGLGYKQSNRKVIHVDSRDKSRHNTTGGSPTHPTFWRYSS